MADGEAVAIDLPQSETTNTAESLSVMAEAGLGIAFLPDFLVAGARTNGRLVAILDAHVSDHRTFCILWRSSRPSLPRIKAFVDFVSARLAIGFTPATPFHADMAQCAQLVDDILAGLLGGFRYESRRHSVARPCKSKIGNTAAWRPGITVPVSTALPSALTATRIWSIERLSAGALARSACTRSAVSDPGMKARLELDQAESRGIPSSVIL